MSVPTPQADPMPRIRVSAPSAAASRRYSSAAKPRLKLFSSGCTATAFWLSLRFGQRQVFTCSRGADSRTRIRRIGTRRLEWRFALMRRGVAPIENLARALLHSGILGDGWPESETSVGRAAARLRVGPRGLTDLFESADVRPVANLLILVDQFEELFRYFEQSDADEALKFVSLLLEGTAHEDLALYVVLTLRSDYIGNCSLFPGLPERLNDTQFLCPRLDRDQMRQAIELPVRACLAETSSQPWPCKFLTTSVTIPTNSRWCSTARTDVGSCCRR